MSVHDGPEYATVRLALGAGRARLIRQLFTESMLLAAVGAFSGVWLATIGLSVFKQWSSGAVPRLADAQIDGMVVAFSAGLALLIGLGFGLLPAYQASKSGSFAGAIKETTQSVVGARSGGRIRSGLVLIQTALSVALLVGAGLLIASLLKLQRVDPGLQVGNVLTLQFDLPAASYREGERTTKFISQLVEGVEALPDVRVAGATSVLPLAGGARANVVTFDDRPAPRSFAEVPIVNSRQITANYLRAVGARLQRGRWFASSDEGSPTGVAIVNEAFARQFWQQADPIGERLYLGPPEALIKLPTGSFPRVTIIGVITDIRHEGLEAEPKPELFTLHSQAGRASVPSLPVPSPGRSMYLVVQTVGDPSTSLTGIRGVISGLDTSLPVSSIRTMEGLLHESLSRRRMTVTALGGFAVIALLITAIGLYGVTAYSVSQRSKEMGLRMALGATSRDVVWMVVRQGASLTLAGVVIGSVLSAVLARFMAGFLFDVQTRDPLVYAGTALLLFASGLAACYIPARHAAHADPIVALRHE